MLAEFVGLWWLFFLRQENENQKNLGTKKCYIVSVTCFSSLLSVIQVHRKYPV